MLGKQTIALFKIILSILLILHWTIALLTTQFIFLQQQMQWIFVLCGQICWYNFFNLQEARWDFSKATFKNCSFSSALITETLPWPTTIIQLIDWKYVWPFMIVNYHIWSYIINQNPWTVLSFRWHALLLYEIRSWCKWHFISPVF